MARKFDESGARQLVERWQASDLSDAAFARRERVSIRQLRRWRDLFAGEPTEGLEFAPVVIREPAYSKQPTMTPFVVELRQGCSIRVAAGFDARELRRLVESLEDIRC